MQARAWRRILLLAAFAMAVSALIGQTQTGQAQDAQTPHFHHVHLNVTDPAATIQFYRTTFGAVPIKFRGVSDALYTERSFILLTKVESFTTQVMEETALWHIGWSGIDGLNEYQYLRSRVEFHTPATALGNNYYMYIYGPDHEVAEIYTGAKNHRFNHMHFYSSNPGVTANWFFENLGIGRQRPTERPPTAQRRWSTGFRSGIDNVGFVVFERQPEHPSPIKPTQGSPIDHFAYGFRDIEPVYERMRAAGVTIVEPIAMREEYNMKSFFALAPDGLLVEIVEAKPIPEGLWD